MAEEAPAADDARVDTLELATPPRAALVHLP